MLFFYILSSRLKHKYNPPSRQTCHEVDKWLADRFRAFCLDCSTSCVYIRPLCAPQLLAYLFNLLMDGESLKAHKPNDMETKLYNTRNKLVSEEVFYRRLLLKVVWEINLIDSEFYNYVQWNEKPF